MENKKTTMVWFMTLLLVMSSAYAVIEIGQSGTENIVIPENLTVSGHTDLATATTTNISSNFINSTKANFRSADCVVNPDGDGDYKTINDCISALKNGALSTNGGTIYVVSGKHTLSSPVVVSQQNDARFIIRGAGVRNTYIEATGNAFEFNLQSPYNLHFEISDMTINGSNTGAGFTVTSSNTLFPSYSVFKNLEIMNFSRGIELDNVSTISPYFDNILLRNNDVAVYVKPDVGVAVYGMHFNRVAAYNSRNYSFFFDGSDYANTGIRWLKFDRIDTGNCLNSNVVGFYGDNINSVTITNPYSECNSGTAKSFILNGRDIDFIGGDTYLDIDIGTNSTTENVYIKNPFTQSSSISSYDITIGGYANYTVIDVGQNLLGGDLKPQVNIVDNGLATQIIGMYSSGSDTYYGFGKTTYFDESIVVNNNLSVPSIVSNVDMNGNNFTNVDTITGNSKPLSIGTSSTAHGSVSSNDLIVSGVLESQSYSYFDNTLNLKSSNNVDLFSFLIGSTAQAFFTNGQDDGLRISSHATDGRGNNHIIFTSAANRAKDHDHDTTSADPTFFIHGSEDPDVDNTEWLSLSYNSTGDYGEFSTGKGDIVFNPNVDMNGNNFTNVDTITGNSKPLSIGTSSSVHGSVSSNDLIVSGVLESQSYSYFDNTVFVKNSYNVDSLDFLVGSTVQMATTVGQDDGVKIAVRPNDGQGNNHIIFTSTANRAKDHDHDTPSTDPTFFIHGSEDPDVDNTEWLSLSYNSTGDYGEFSSGKGDIVFNPIGNVGIGMTAPRYKLDVDGNVAIGNVSIALYGLGVRSDVSGGMSLPRFENQAATVGSLIGLSLATAEGESVRPRGYLVAGADGSNNGYLSFYTREAGTITEKVRIDNNGNVGIGTTSPVRKLEIDGGTDNAILRLTSSDTFSYIEFVDSGTPVGDVLMGVNAGNIIFYTGTGGSERMRIDTNGNVGIGTSNTNQKLNVIGNSNVTGTMYYGALQANSPILKRTDDPFVAECTTASNGDFVVEYVKYDNGQYTRVIEKVDVNNDNWWHKECWEKKAKFDYLDSLENQQIESKGMTHRDYNIDDIEFDWVTKTPYKKV